MPWQFIALGGAPDGVRGPACAATGGGAACGEVRFFLAVLGAGCSDPFVALVADHSFRQSCKHIHRHRL